MDSLLSWACLLLVLMLFSAGGATLLTLFIVGSRRRRFMPPTYSTAGSSTEGGAAPCPQCGWILESSARRCLKCGLLMSSTEAAELRRIDSAQRLLRELSREGKLDHLTCDLVLDRLKERRGEVVGWKPSLTIPALKHAPQEDEVLDVLPAVEPAAAASVPPLPPSPPRILPRPQAPRAAPPPRPPRRSLAEMLAGFMEERNILWGEIVGGLLIVGCSIALVVSLWQTLKTIPYFPFLAMAASTAALFGGGLYTLRRWRLESTSRGLLFIATLLVPLNFLVMAGLPSLDTGSGWPDLLIQIGSLALFAWLIRLSGEVLVPVARWWLTLAVAGVSAMQLLVPRLLKHGVEVDAWRLHVLGGLPVGMALIGMAGLLLAYRRGAWGLVEPSAPDSERQASAADYRSRRVLVYLGMSSFALAVTMAFLVYWTRAAGELLQLLSPWIALAGLPVLAAGVFITRQEQESRHSVGASSHLALAGTIVTLLGPVIMLLAAALAWPNPTVLIVVCAIDAIVLLGVALRFDLPALYPAALACLTLGYLTAVHVYGGRLEPPYATALPMALASGLTGLALLVPAGGMLGAAGILFRRHRPAHGLQLLIGTGGLAAWSLVLVNFRYYFPAVEDVAEISFVQAALVHAAFALAAVAANLRLRQAAWTYVAALLVLGALFYALAEQPPQWRMLIALLGVASIAAAAIDSRQLAPRDAHRIDERWTNAFAVPCFVVAMAATVLAFLPLWRILGWDRMPASAGCFVWLAAIWLALGWVQRRPGLLMAMQLALAIALVCGVTAWLQRQEWIEDYPSGLAQPHALQAYGIALALFTLPWLALRKILDRWVDARELLEPTGWLTVDRVLLYSLILGQIALCVWGLYPGLVRELTVGDPSAIAWSENRLQAVDYGAWICLAVLAAVLIPALWDRERQSALLGLLALGCTVPVLTAALFREQNASASAWRWGAGLAFLLLSTLVWLREPILRFADRVGIERRVMFHPLLMLRIRLFLGTFVPVLLLTGVVAYLGFQGLKPVGAEAGSIFARMGWVASHVVPLLILAVALVGHALRERSPVAAFAAGILVNVTLVGGYALGMVLSLGSLTPANQVELLQLATFAAGAWGYAWLLSRRWTAAWRESADTPSARPLMLVQMGLGLAGNVALLGVAVASLLVNLPLHDPLRPLNQVPSVPLWTLAAGTWLGWAALIATCLPVFHSLRRRAPRFVVHGVGVLGLLAGILVCCTVARGDSTGGWVAQHALTVSWGVLGVLVLAASWAGSSLAQVGPMSWGPERRAAAARTLGEWFAVLPSRAWVQVLALAVVLLALRGTGGDPSRPYWSAGATLSASVLIGLLAIWERNGALVYASGLLINLVGLLVWQAWLVDEVGVVAWVAFGQGMFDRFLFVNLLCLALSATSWCAIEMLLARRDPPILLRTRWIPYSRLAPLVALLGSLVLCLMGIASDLANQGLYLGGPLCWWTFGAIVIAVLPGLWDDRYRFTLAELFIAGLTFLGWLLHSLRLEPDRLLWCTTLAISAYLLLTAAVGLLAQHADRLWAALRLEWKLDRQWSAWLLPAQIALGGCILFLSFWMTLDFAGPLDRLAGPMALALVTFAVWFSYARRSLVSTTTAMTLRVAVLALIAVSACQVGWALIGSDVPAPWLQRLAVLFVVLVGMTEFCVSVLPRFAAHLDPWRESGRLARGGFAAAACCTLIALMASAALLFDSASRQTPLLPPLVWLGAAAILLLCSHGIRFAVQADLDPLGLDETQRTLYVYLSELVLLAGFVHLRLNVPWLFRGTLAHYWTFIVMGLAFLAVGLSEWFSRRGQKVLAQPLLNSGILLPFVPLLVFWTQPSHRVIPTLGTQVIGGFELPFWQHATHWMLAGALFGIIALARGRFWFAFLAGLFLNFALWALWGQFDLAFDRHLQLWLIPLSLILLLSEHVNRERLTPVQGSAIRNAALLLLYLSATADMFVTGLGHSALLPILLASFAVAGVLVGILLHVRAFLVQGVAFLFVVIFAQIWHAAVDREQTWVWWASGIVLGAAILALFAVFEKRKQDVLRVVDQLKQWE